MTRFELFRVDPNGYEELVTVFRASEAPRAERDWIFTEEGEDKRLVLKDINSGLTFTSPVIYYFTKVSQYIVCEDGMKSTLVKPFQAP